MKISDFYTKHDDRHVRCLLCPHHCSIPEGAYGKCRVRLNREGDLYQVNYGLLCSISSDPVEKKPLYHFFPGSEILSIGSFGCNFSCSFCQNYTISQASPTDFEYVEKTSPEAVIDRAKKSAVNAGIAYTYNEPTVWFGYMYDTCRLAKDCGLKNVVVSNGYINKDPLNMLLEVTDAFNIDLKAFDNSFYRNFTGGSLRPVLSSLYAIKMKGVHLEITLLVIPGLNDDMGKFRDLTGWIEGELGNDTVLHISRYFPSWKMHRPPAPVSTINEFYDTAKETLSYVYTGNMPPGSPGRDTECARCGKRVIKREGYITRIEGLDSSGNCACCHNPVAVM